MSHTCFRRELLKCNPHQQYRPKYTSCWALALQAQADQVTAQQAAQQAKQDLAAAERAYHTATTHYNNAVAFHQHCWRHLSFSPAAVPV